jgi:hypothetical protein
MPEPSTHASKRTMRRVAAFAIIAIAALTLVYGVWKQDANRTETDTASPAAQRAYPDVVTVYYFHGDTRCDTCLDIESKTWPRLRSNFADADRVGPSCSSRSSTSITPEHAHFRMTTTWRTAACSCRARGRTRVGEPRRRLGSHP